MLQIVVVSSPETFSLEISTVKDEYHFIQSVNISQHRVHTMLLLSINHSIFEVDEILEQGVERNGSF